MAYFLGSDCLVALTTEDDTYGVQVGTNAGAYVVSGNSTVTNGINKKSTANLSSGSALADLTGLDIGIGALGTLDMLKDEEGKAKSYLPNLVEYRSELARIANEDLGKPILLLSSLYKKSCFSVDNISCP